MSATAPLELRDASAGYAPNAPVVEGVGFALRAGAMTALIGPNGAGKSTLLHAILGLGPWLRGEVRMLGATLDAVRGRVAFIPQRSAIDWSFPATALDVAAMGGYRRLGIFRRVDAATRAAARAALDEVGLAAEADAQVGELSGGQQQRVLVARALVQDAALFLLDEPFANIDAASEERIVAALRRATAAGATVLAVQHDLAGVRRNFDEALLLNRRLLAQGSVDAVLSGPNLATAYGFAVRAGGAPA